MGLKIFLTDDVDGSRSLRRFIRLAILEYQSRSFALKSKEGPTSMPVIFGLKIW